MGDDSRILRETTEGILRDHLGEGRPRTGGWSPELWRALKAAGLPDLFLTDGLSGADIWAVLSALGRTAAPAPIAEHMLARRLQQGHGLESDADVLTLATGTSGGAGPLRLPGGDHAQAALAILTGEAGPALVLIPVDGLGLETAPSPGADPVVQLAADDPALFTAARAGTNDADILVRQGAILRSVQMAGALERVLELTTGYAQERVQFGRPLTKFQAIQHELAELAEETALAVAAARRALDLLDAPDALFEIAAAKSQCGEAATRAAALAHQIHGAMGFTAEYELHQLTRRLWAWREEFGSEAWWQRRLGAEVARAGADALWPAIAGA